MPYRLKYTGREVDRILEKADNAKPVNVVTQAEYDALTQEEKESAIYFIDNDGGVQNGS